MRTRSVGYVFSSAHVTCFERRSRKSTVSAYTMVFQVRLLLGKEVLPLFGGAPAVWTVCVLVFQLLFLAGYGYSHGLATWLPLRRQVIVHGALLGASAVF